MTSSSFSWSPSPSSLDETDLRPEKIRLEVFRNPRSQDPQVEPAGVFSLQVVDEGSAVFDEASVSPDPDLQNAAFAELVRAPQYEAHAVAVAKQREQAIRASCIVVRSVWKEANAVAVVSDGVVGELNQFVMTRVDPGFNDIQGVQGRRGLSDRFLGHLVAANFGEWSLIGSDACLG